MGINKEDFVDSAIYQQLIAENIEPEINFNYFPYEYEGKLLGIFKISECLDKPYMMKKDFRNLKKGDSFIRKGSRQAKLERKDIDRIIEDKIRRDGFQGMVQISFSGYGPCRQIELTTVGDMKKPSQRAAEEIERIIKEKKQQARKNAQDSALKGFAQIWESQRQVLENSRKVANPFTPIPYGERSLTELEKNLKEVEQTYLKDDQYEFFELNSHKINICVLNQGHTYIEDASIKLEIEKTDGLIVVDKIYEVPENGLLITSTKLPSYESRYYPEVKEIGSSITVYQKIGDVKHHFPIDSFKVPIRIVLLNELAGKTIEMKCRIFGKNLMRPLDETLGIKVISPVND